jgi:catechol 2,3-dioxygenase-like lactoylglutathione lyase family enzyme
LLSNSGFATLVGIKDMDRAIKFYTKTLGAKLQMRGDGEMRDSWASLKLGKHEFWLIRPEVRQRKKQDVTYNAFIVKNIKATVNALQKKGVKFQRAEKMDGETRIDGPIAYNPFGSSAFFYDSEGNLFMLWQ